MICPRCGKATKDDWKDLQTTIPSGERLGGEVGLADLFERGVPLRDTRREFVTFDWMRCEWEDCFQTVVRCHETTVEWFQNVPIQHTQVRFVYPFGSSTPREPLPEGVPTSMRRDYEEGAAILDVSPRMTTVLTSKVLYDLLEKYAGIAEYTLNGSINKFIVDTAHPTRIRENLGHWREIRDFSAHTKRSKNEDDESFGAIIEPGREEAEWTLDMLDRLFAYFVTEPEQEKQLRERWDKNIADAGRNPIRPLPENEE